MSSLRDQFEGREFDWFAIDSAGHLGHFSTAGFGPVPTCVLERFVEADSLPEEISRLPVSGEATANLSGNVTEWMEMARRGLYSFDWGRPNGSYRRVATPHVPIHVSAVPLQVFAAQSIAKFPGVCFSELVQFWPERECACE